MNIETINKSILPQKELLLHHSLYNKVQTIEDLHYFLENHVYAVWDFMSLLKALQSKLTCTTTPWFATTNPQTRYLINEIVVAEESDLTIDDAYHYMELPRRIGGEIMKTLKDGRMVGISSSRCYSYYFRKMISLCVIDAELNVPGTEVEVLWGVLGGHTKRVKATVAPAPYKKDRRRAELAKMG